VRWRYPLALFLVCVPVLIVAPPATAAPITVACNGDACSSDWYKTSVTVTFTWDPLGVTQTSGCDTNTVTSDTTGWSRTCTVTYSNGSQSQLPVTIKKDATPPAVAGASPSRGSDSNGWYNHSVGVTFNGSDATSGLSGCTSTTYTGPDSGSASFSGTCTDRAGNVSAPASFGPIQYDATPPSISAGLSRGPDSNGWYNHPVSFSASGGDNLSGLAGCNSGTYGGPDGNGARIDARCTDRAGNSSSSGAAINYDATPPAVTGATPDRPPDSNGWYNHSVTIGFTGTDATSGGVSCDRVAYKGPDTPGVTINGGCTDAAGNKAGGGSFSLKYDATPPTITNVGVDWDDGSATLTWTASADTTSIEIDRVPGANGPEASAVFKGLASRFEDRGLTNKVKYIYTITGFDEAANNAVETVTIIPAAKLYSPARGAVVTSPPLLAWRRVPGASYYNVQLFYGVANKALRRVALLSVSGRKVLSAWPLQPRYRLKKAWTFKRKRHTLARGRYRWYVYPGFGKRTAHKYGPLIGQSDFFVGRR
jgi:hypothetical protein